jgi:hypothetical protein
MPTMNLLEVDGLEDADMSQLADLDSAIPSMVQNGLAEALHHS